MASRSRKRGTTLGELHKSKKSSSHSKPMNPIIKKFYIIVVLIFILIMVCIITWLVVDMNNTADDYKDRAIALEERRSSSKDKFMTDWSEDIEYKKYQSSIDSGTTNNGFPNINGNGKLVTDISKNPLGLPIYDGYTSDGNSFDVDYTKFHGTSYSNSELHGLGDFTNSSALNTVSREFVQNELSGQGKRPAGVTKYIWNNPTKKEVGGIWTVEDRIAIALPAGAIIDPVIYEPMISTHWSNLSKYTSKLDGTAAITSVPGVWSSSEQPPGMKVDMIMGDGTVLACIIMDHKAFHSGTATNGDILQG